MKILKTMTRKNLGLNRRRTVSNIIGIMLSAALICAVATMVSSFVDSMIAYARTANGDWHFQTQSATRDFTRRVALNRQVEDVFEADTVGYARLAGSQNAFKPNVQITTMDPEAFRKMHFSIKEGRFPKNAGELIISDSIITNGGVDYKVGDRVTFQFYESGAEAQSQVEENDESAMYQSEDMQPVTHKVLTKEALKYLNGHSFRIVGIMERPGYGFELFNDSAYTVITSGMEKQIAPYTYRTFFRLKDPAGYREFYEKTFKTPYDRSYEREDVRINENLLQYEGRGFSESSLKTLYALAGLAVLVILASSILCIRNSFSISVTEKMKQYGLLASVGATKRQIRKCVYHEAFSLALCGIPLGIGLGLLADKIVIRVVNGILQGIVPDEAAFLIFSPSPAAAAIAALLGGVTVFLSALSSAQRAARISPIEGIRSTQDIKGNPKKLKTPGWVKRLFGIGGTIAYKNLARSRKKYRTTVISIVVSITVFVVMTAFIENAFKTQDVYLQDRPYNISVLATAFEDEKAVDQLLSMEKYDFSAVLSVIRGEDGTKRDEMSLEGKNLYTKAYQAFDDKNSDYVLDLVAYDDKTFQYLAKQAGMDYNKVKESGILYDGVTFFDGEEEKYKETRRYIFESGDTVKGKVGAQMVTLKVYPTTEQLTLLGNNRQYSSKSVLVIDKDQHPEWMYSAEEVFLDSKNPDRLERKVNQSEVFAAKDNGGSEKGGVSKILQISNVEKAKRESDSVMLIIYIFAYGFIAVITLIGLTNIFNTITSNVELRQSEFASLKSIGMTKKEFHKMICLETLFYCTKALGIGSALGLLGNWMIRKILARRFEFATRYYPVKPIALSAVIVFVLVFVIMQYSIAKINRKNIIETIRKENI